MRPDAMNSSILRTRDWSLLTDILMMRLILSHLLLKQACVCSGENNVALQLVMSDLVSVV